MAVRSVAVGSDPAMAAVSQEEAKVAPTGEEKWAETEEAAREVAEAEAEEAEEVATPAEAAERRGALLAEATVGAEEVRKVVLPAALLDNAAHLAVCMVAVRQEVLRARRLMEYSSGPRHIRSHHAHTRSCSGRNPVCSKTQ